MEDGPITDITYPDFPRNWEWKTIELYPGETDGREREAWDVAQVTLVKLKDIPEPYRKIVKLEGPSEIEDTWTLTWQQWETDEQYTHRWNLKQARDRQFALDRAEMGRERAPAAYIRALRALKAAEEKLTTLGLPIPTDDEPT